jgi:adenylate cyclase
MPFSLSGVENPYRFELRPGTTLLVGRAVESDCAVVDATVSRRHAQLVVSDNGVQVKDIGSSNGTFVNGVKVDGYFVVPGDTLTFGKVVFRVEELSPITAPIIVTPAAGAPATVADRSASSGDTGPRREATIVRLVTQPVPIVRTSGSFKAVLSSDADPAEKDREKLRILLEVSTGLTRAIDVDALLDKVAGYAFEILEADRCAILLHDDQGVLTTKVSRDKRGADAPQAVPLSIARKAIAEKVAVLSDNALEDQRFTGESVNLEQVRSALCAPLIGSEDRVLGVLYVDDVAAGRFREADLDFLIAFAGIAAVAIENSQFADRIRREALVRSNFERFFTPQLAARIANSGDAVKLGGDKRPVAILFSDIRGFASLSETMNPDAMARLLTEYFSEMVECVFRHGGTLDKFIGDAVMAQWGAPLGAPDDADHAMASALDMMDALGTLNASWAAEGRPTLQIGIGLNFGEAFAGNIGSERRLEYTVIGDTVNTASRVCRSARPGEILVTEAFRLALQEPPRLSTMPPIELRGKSQLVSVYSVTR